MKSIHFGFIISSMTCFALSFLLTVGCSNAKKSGADASAKQSNSSLNTTNFLSLADYLRRYPSVRISGSGEDLTVTIRSTDTFVGAVEPLFVIDRNVTADSYVQAARLVDVNDILSVRVLTGVEGQAEYGMRGTNGVVIIKTRGNK